MLKVGDILITTVEWFVDAPSPTREVKIGELLIVVDPREISDGRGMTILHPEYGAVVWKYGWVSNWKDYMRKAK